MRPQSLAQIAAFTEWVDRAREITVRAELERRGLWSAKMAGDSGIPCPVCGGRDRFAVNTRKNIWNCRGSGKGGDAIALAEYLDGGDFLLAVETLTGSPPPNGSTTETDEERHDRERRMKERTAQARQREEKAAADEIDRCETQRTQAHAIWRKAAPIGGTAVEAYLGKRRLVAPKQARLRHLDNHPLWSKPGGGVLWRGPAMIAAMEGPDGRFSGVHQTWIDLARPDGKAMVRDPETGEIIAAKKVRGSWKGATIPLSLCENPVRSFLGEGIETVLSVLHALILIGSPLLDGAEFRSAVSLGNLSGKAADRVSHPTLHIIRKDGGDGGPRKIPGPTPAAVADDIPIIRLADSVKELFLLGDGDSDPFTTRISLRRSSARFLRAYPHLTIFAPMAAPGKDFNDMLRGIAP